MKRLTYPQLLVPALALIFVAMACTMPGQNVIVVTATPSAPPVTPTITPIPATATKTPTITPSPEPTVAVNIASVQANTALHNGDYAAAVTIYKEILSRPILSVDPRLRSDAAIGLGTADLREGKF